MELEITIRQEKPLVKKEEFNFHGDWLERWIVNLNRDVQIVRYNHYNPDTWVKIDEDITNMDFSEVGKYLEDKLC